MADQRQEQDSLAPVQSVLLLPSLLLHPPQQLPSISQHCAPGVILSKINEAIYSKQEILDAKLESIPLGRIGSPKDIGDIVACMVSDAFSISC